MPHTLTEKPQTEDDQSFFDELIYQRDLATNYREARYTDEWEENTNYYFGDQYTQDFANSIARWRSLTVNNIIYPTVEQLHALLTDDQTIAFVQRMAEGSFTVERILDSLIQQIWGKQDITSKISQADKDRLMWGTSFFKVWRNRHSDEKLKIEVERVSPWNFFPDPLALDIQDCRFTFERERTSKTDLLQKHPKHADVIMMADGRAGSSFVSEGNAENSSSYEPEVLYVWHCYIDDLVMFERDTRDITEERVKEIKKKFPNGRYVKLLGDFVLETYPNDLPFKPYIRLPLIEVPDEFFGLSVVTPMKFPQEELNKTESMLFDNLKSNINPIIKVTEGMFDLDEFVPLPNSVVTVRNNDDVFEKIPGVQLPSQVFAQVSQKREETMAAAGVNEVTFGAGAQSSRPGTVKANFQASVTRLREYTRLKHRAIEKIGQMIIKIVQLHTPKNTIISLADPDHVIFNYEDFDTQDELKDAYKNPQLAKNLEIGNVKLNEVPPEFEDQIDEAIDNNLGAEVFGRGQAKELLLSKGISDIKNNVKDGDYNYVVKSHPLTVRDPDSLMELFQMLLQYGSADPATGQPGIIDYKFVLDNIELDGKADLIRRLENKEKQFAAQQQALAAQQTQPQGGQ